MPTTDRVTGCPVKGFPIQYTWQTNAWRDLFDKQVELLQSEIARAKANDQEVIYLSCPISNRGGGFFTTNIEIANFTQKRLQNQYGRRFWFLNPAQYQMESKEGTGLIYRHAKELGMTPQDVDNLPYPIGGDYMRMWTRVLIEDGLDNIGESFSAFYFLGPKDVADFFKQNGATDLSNGIESYFASKFAMDPDFKAHFDASSNSDWEKLRQDFVRFYGLRAGASFSKGCHDEWNIAVASSNLRIKKGGIGTQPGMFFDQAQAPMGASPNFVLKGYSENDFLS